MNSLLRHPTKRAAENAPATIFDLITRPISDWGFFTTPMPILGANFKVDLKDDGDHYELTADLPGVKKDDVKISFEDGVLTVKAQMSQETKNKNEKGYLVQERSTGSMQRSFYLEDADESKGDAVFENGVLKLTLGKKEGRTPKIIAVK